jgi:hypothetical protein
MVTTKIRAGGALKKNGAVMAKSGVKEESILTASPATILILLPPPIHPA